MKYLVLGLLLLTGCAKNPANNGYDFVILSQQDEYELGRSYRKTVKNSKIYKDEEKQEYFNNLAQKVYNVGERPEKNMVFYLMKDDNPNACATPGYVFFNTGILPYLNDEAAVMAIMAHEAGHINARHMVRKNSNNFLTSWFMNMLPTKWIRGNRDNFSKLTDLKYSRNYETEADLLSVKYLKKLDVPTVNGVSFHKTMQMREDIMLKLIDLNKDEYEAKTKRTPEYLLTHPLSKKRAAMIEDKSSRWFALMEPYRQKEYYQQIDRMPYGYKGSKDKEQKVLVTKAGASLVKDKMAGIYGYKNIAYMKKQRLKLIMPEDYQARVMSSDPLGFNYKDRIKVAAYQTSDDKNIYALDIVADILGLNRWQKKKMLKKAQKQEKSSLENGEQLFSYEISPNFIKRLFGQDTSYYYIYVKQLDDDANVDYMNHFRIVILSTNIKKSFDETMLNDILFIKDNLVELTKEQAKKIKPLTIKTKQAKTSQTIQQLSKENIPYIHFEQEWFRLFNGLYDELNTEVQTGAWLKLIPNPNKDI